MLSWFFFIWECFVLLESCSVWHRLKFPENKESHSCVQDSAKLNDWLEPQDYGVVGCCRPSANWSRTGLVPLLVISFPLCVWPNPFNILTSAFSNSWEGSSSSSVLRLCPSAYPLPTLMSAVALSLFPAPSPLVLHFLLLQPPYLSPLTCSFCLSCLMCCNTFHSVHFPTKLIFLSQLK